jgi:hypothetical protein
MDRRLRRITHTFTQSYGNWEVTPMVDAFTARTDTFDILEALDILEPSVYSDREYEIATGMLNDIGIRSI